MLKYCGSCGSLDPVLCFQQQCRDLATQRAQEDLTVEGCQGATRPIRIYDAARTTLVARTLGPALHDHVAKFRKPDSCKFGVDASSVETDPLWVSLSPSLPAAEVKIRSSTKVATEPRDPHLWGMRAKPSLRAFGFCLQQKELRRRISQLEVTLKI